MSAFTDEMACLYAGISPGSLYNYCNENPKFLERKEHLKKSPDLVAQKTLVEDLKNIAGARWWAEHRMKDFKPKSQVEHTGTIATEGGTSAATQEVINKFEDELRKTIARERTAA